MKLDLSRYLPAGMETKKFTQPFWGCLCGMVIYQGITFLFGFSDAKAQLYRVRGGVRVLGEGAIMMDYVDLIRGWSGSLAATILVMLGMIIYHYFYHRQGSRSIYLMRRLPKRWELHRRCLTAPLAAIVIYLVFALILLLIGYGIYMLATPAECLTPGQWQKIWSVFV